MNRLSAIFLMVLIGACSQTDDKSNSAGPCTVVVVDSETYCAWKNSILVETGYECPAMQNNLHEFDAVTICSEDPEPPDLTVITEVEEQLDDPVVVNNTNNTNNANNTNNTNNGTNNTNNTNNGQPGPEFAAVYQIVVDKCANLACHSAAAPSVYFVPANNNATPEEVFDALRTTSSTADGLTLIVPFDPDSSNVITRMRLQPSGDLREMPLGTGGAPEDIADFEAWINAGATFN